MKDRIKQLKNELQNLGSQKDFLNSLREVAKDEKEYKEGERWIGTRGHFDTAYFYSKKEALRNFRECKKELQEELEAVIYFDYFEGFDNWQKWSFRQCLNYVSTTLDSYELPKSILRSVAWDIV